MEKQSGGTSGVWKQAFDSTQFARLFWDWPDREPVATVAAVPADSAWIEVHAPSVVRDARIEGGWPIVAAGTCVAKARAIPVTRGGKEDAIAVGAGDLVSAAGPCPLAFISQFSPLSVCWYTPSAAKFYVSSVIRQIKKSFVIRESIISKRERNAILG